MKLLIHRCHRWGKYDRRKEHQQTSNGTKCRNSENCNVPITANHSWLWYKGHCSITQLNLIAWRRLVAETSWSVPHVTIPSLVWCQTPTSHYYMALWFEYIVILKKVWLNTANHSWSGENSVPILLTTPSLTFHLWSSENQIVGFRSRSSLRKHPFLLRSSQNVPSDEEGRKNGCFHRLKQKWKDKPITMHIHKLLDWFSSSASASESNNLVFTRS